MAADELVDWVDEDDRVIGQVTRARMRAENLLHRCIAVLCCDSAGSVYAHRRSDAKDMFPGLYDMFVGGVVGAGESYDAAARREIGEELGIVGPIPQPLFRHRYEGEASRSHTAVYRVSWDGPITHQESEIAWGGLRTLQELAEGPEGWSFVPDGREIFERLLRERLPLPGAPGAPEIRKNASRGGET
ncbi:MAG TPA: NUDIX domain-containing protein [Polyangiales bacterium]|nr:NUDIX domain-containing protein [Polyangiales bacterium]